MQTPRKPEIKCWDCFPLVGATELCSPEPSPRPSLRSPHKPTSQPHEYLHTCTFCTNVRHSTFENHCIYVPYIYMLFYWLPFTCPQQKHWSQIPSMFTHEVWFWLKKKLKSPFQTLQRHPVSFFLSSFLLKNITECVSLATAVNTISNCFSYSHILFSPAAKNSHNANGDHGFSLISLCLSRLLLYKP